MDHTRVTFSQDKEVNLSRHLLHKRARSSGSRNRSPMPKHGHFRSSYRRNGLRRDKGMY